MAATKAARTSARFGMFCTKINNTVYTYSNAYPQGDQMLCNGSIKDGVNLF